MQVGSASTMASPGRTCSECGGERHDKRNCKYTVEKLIGALPKKHDSSRYDFEYTPGEVPQDETTGRNISEGKRKIVFAFCDGECFYCREKLKFFLRKGDGAWEVDHMHPFPRDGLSTYFNLAAACTTCNSEKGGSTPKEFGSRRCEGFTGGNMRCKENIAEGKIYYCRYHGPSGKQ